MIAMGFKPMPFPFKLELKSGILNHSRPRRSMISTFEKVWSWQLWDLNARPFEPEPKSGTLNHLAKLSQWMYPEKPRWSSISKHEITSQYMDRVVGKKDNDEMQHCCVTHDRTCTHRWRVWSNKFSFYISDVWMDAGVGLDSLYSRPIFKSWDF